MTWTPRRIDGYAPIEDYAAIGNKRTVAMIAADGAIDWWCPQGFDAPSALGALIDARRGGSFALAPDVPFTVQRAYRPRTNVLETTFTTDEGTVRVTDAMSLPMPRALDYNEIVRRIDGTAGTVTMRWRVAPRFGYGARTGAIERAGDAVLIRDSDHVLVLQSSGAGDARTGGGDVAGRFDCAEGDVAVLSLSSFDSGPLALPGRDQLLDRLEATAAHWERWAAGCATPGRWEDLVVRSALALDLMVDADTSAIVAAPTMGLPECLGGSRNYDYRYAWLRDGSLTLEAMRRLGYTEQVHASLSWMLHATAHTHPRLRPMYRLDGRATLPDRPLDLDGWRGSRPVTLGNGAQGQLQLGSYGDVFDMAWHYVDDGNALAPGAGVRLAELADYVCRVWQLPDSGLWELGDERHYTQSKLACALTLRRASQLAALGLLPDRSEHWDAVHADVAAYVRERCWSERRQAYTRSADSEELDAAVLLAARGSFVAAEPERLSSTVDAVREELGAGGPLLYRFSGMQDREGAFLACSFWAAEALARCGRVDEGETMLDELAGLASDVGLYSEEIDPDSGGMRGNMPQALTHLALVNAVDVIARERAAVGQMTARR